MQKFTVNLIVLLALGLKATRANPECFTNPLVNPSLCYSQFRDLMKTFNHQAAHQDTRLFRAGPMRKTNALLLQDQDDAVVNNSVNGENITFNQKIAEVINKLRRIAVKNNIEGEEVNTKQDVKEYNRKKKSRKTKRIAVANNIKGQKVDTNQDIKEFNDLLADENAMKELLKDLHKDTKTEGDYIKILIKTLRRIGVKNKISGVNVNTKQKITEYNDVQDDDQDDAMRDDQQLLPEFRRVAVRNDIKGTNVNTEQDLKEYNNDEINAILDQIRRVAVSNTIKGKVVNTNQDIKEYNDDAQNDDLNVVLDQLRRVAVSNNIKGETVNTDQKIKEYNDDLLNDDITILIKKLRRIAIDNKIQGSNVKTTQDIKEFNENPQDDSVNVLIKKLQRIALSNDIKGKTVNTNQDIKEFNDNDDETQNLDEIDALKDEADDEQQETDDENDDEADDDAEQDDAKNDAGRRMTVNNNVNEARRIAIDNNIKGDVVKTDQKVTEINAGEGESANATKNEVVTTTPKSMPPVKLRPKPIKPQKASSSSSITCTTKDGKMISEKDLRNFLDLLKKLKAAKKLSEVAKSI